jgi:hypothetical protein
MADIPTSQDDLLQRINAAWAELQASLTNLTDTQLNSPDEGGWSIKDNIAHLAAWENHMLRTHLEGKPAGEVLGFDQATMEAGETAINAAIQKRSAVQTAAQVLAEARTTHAEVLQVLRATPFADLLKPRFADDPEKQPMLIWVINNTYEHYAEHGANIQKHLKHLAG